MSQANRNYFTKRTSSQTRSSARPSYGGARYSSTFRSSKRRPQARQLDERLFVHTNTTPNNQESYEATHLFKDFDLHADIQQNLSRKGYEKPTPIQDQAIPHILQGRDMIGLANTGTGKTGAFVLPLIHLIGKEKKRQSALIITPTRELAEQVNDEFKSFAMGLKLYSAVCVGGVSIGKQIREIERGVHVIIGTPGRLKDLANRGIIHLSQVEILVLDEADHMLDMGFLPDVKTLIGMTPTTRQVLCFSATMDDRVRALIHDIQKDPVTVSVTQKQTSNHIFQDVIRTQSKEAKFEQLTELLKNEDFDKVLVFAETKWNVQRLSDALTETGIASDSIHGNKSQSQRQRSLNKFKTGSVSVLVATDVAARGLDIPNVDLVVNYEQPQTHETYIHRIGRTGRAGKNGQARTFVS